MTVDSISTLHLTHNISSVILFYVDNSDQLHNLYNLVKLLINYYQSLSDTANNKVYNNILSSFNYSLICSYYDYKDDNF